MHKHNSVFLKFKRPWRYFFEVTIASAIISKFFDIVALSYRAVETRLKCCFLRPVGTMINIVQLYYLFINEKKNQKLIEMLHMGLN